MIVSSIGSAVGTVIFGTYFFTYLTSSASVAVGLVLGLLIGALSGYNNVSRGALVKLGGCRSGNFVSVPLNSRSKMVFQWFNFLLIGIGIFVAIDGVGSVLIKRGQYHSIWFDGERYVRALAGLLIIALGIIVR